MKRCLTCMRKIPLLAGRCPYCLDNDQGVHGRFILLLLLILGLVFGGKCYLESKQSLEQKELTKILKTL